MSRKNEKVEMLLKIKAESVRAGADLISDRTMDWQLIKQYMTNRHKELVLTADQQRKLERYQFIYNQLVSGKYTDRDVVLQLKKLFNVSEAQAYEDLNCSRELFTSVININRQFELNNELQIAKAARGKCLEVLDFKNAAAFGKVIKDLIAMLPEEEVSPGMDFEGHILEAVFDPSLLGAPDIDMEEVLRVLNEKRNVPVKIDMFSHLDYEEVKKDDEETTAL